MSFTIIKIAFGYDGILKQLLGHYSYQICSNAYNELFVNFTNIG